MREPSRRLRLFLLASLLGLGFVTGISVVAGQAGGAISSVYERANIHFAAVDLYKPRETNVTDLEFKLAPLVLQEVAPRDNSQGKQEDQFGALDFEKGRPALDRSKPTIYVMVEPVQIQRTSYLQLTYFWFYALKRPTSQRALPVQGVRITLNSAGAPVVWEVLADSSGPELIFVADSLERASAAEFGLPLPGRKFAIEQRVAKEPRVVVARVISDGPLPMGPIIYLSRATHRVATLVCRCMPAQAGQTRRSCTYDLIPLNPSAAGLLAQVRTSLQTTTAFWPGDSGGAQPLEQSLRLPSAAW
ncbi:MAG TPA: hypothetical protein VG167_08530 [Verrucomicrobiae bacterium]|nr:hypothetical protein [Verrucomicrobiae bacterium]